MEELLKELGMTEEELMEALQTEQELIDEMKRLGVKEIEVDDVVYRIEGDEDEVEFDIEKMKEDGVYEDFLKIIGEDKQDKIVFKERTDN